MHLRATLKWGPHYGDGLADHTAQLALLLRGALRHGDNGCKMFTSEAMHAVATYPLEAMHDAGPALATGPIQWSELHHRRIQERSETAIVYKRSQPCKIGAAP